MNTTAAECETRTAQNTEAFAAWAQVYDAQANPLLALEERFLRRLLPDIDGKDILDVGCGTGRWLEHLAYLGSPRSLCGIDSSDEMLAVARRKSLDGATLLQTQLPLLPLPSASVDLTLASFVLSYISDVDGCAGELARVLRDDGELIVADMHPATAVELGWQRSFSSSQGTIHLHNNNRLIETTVRSMTRHGLRLLGSYQPSFAEPERSIFLSYGKEASYQKAAGRPAIYLLHFKRHSTTPAQANLLLRNTQCVVGPEEITSADLTLQNSRVATISAGYAQFTVDNHVDLSGYTLFPGLINAHDHLEFGLFPRLGTPPYLNATEWARDIQNSARDIITVHKQVAKSVRLWWGALRNLICGVTTVCHHNPYHPVFNEPEFPIRIVEDFGWEHSLAFAEDLSIAYSRIHNSDPFIIHACEGIDDLARSEFAQLKDLNFIDERTVLVHGLAMTPGDVDTLNRCGASLISCPSSNQFLFSKTTLPEQLESIHRLAIGSDSPLTATGDLLDEINFCSRQLHLSPNRLFDCVTRMPAQILRLKDGEGRIAPGSAADLFAVRSSALTPARHLTSLSWRDVELVIIKGSVRLASAEVLQRLPRQLSKHLSCLLIDGAPRWLDAPVSTLFNSAAEVLGARNVSLGGLTVSLMET
jgi:cytosine/adenosine deaminase-related metal-dependent hydrolase/ubiquinone/menaquinone biosynthesis C-methylase UbiE